MNARIDLAGQRFGRWFVVSYADVAGRIAAALRARAAGGKGDV